MKLGIVIQARLGSTRFPQKIAAPITEKANVLEYVTEPLLKLGLPVVIAFPDSEDHRLFAKGLSLPGVSYFFGAEDNVLLRFVEAARTYSFSSVVRICGDNPFLNTGFMKQMIGAWNESADYLTWFTKQGVPAMKTHYGLFSEIARVSSLEKVLKDTHERYYLEHVTPYFYEHSDLFRIGRLSMPEPFWSGTSLRLTLDTEQDIITARKVAEGVNAQDVNALLEFCKDPVIATDMEREIVKNTK
jgi:spore coat polysaccharide biosynthesis protein SpsF